MASIYRFFLIAEGRDTGYPNYSDATVHFELEDPCNLRFQNSFISSPLFSVFEEGVSSIPQLSNGITITFIMMPRIFPDLGEMITEVRCTNEIWFTLGLANVVVIEKTGGKMSEQVIGFLKARSNIVASETWLIEKNKLKAHTFPYSQLDHKTTDVVNLNLPISKNLPLHIKFAVSEFLILSNKFLTASKKFTPYYYNKLEKVIDASKQLINDLSFLHGDFNFPPDDSLLSEIGVKNAAEAIASMKNGVINKRKEELINDRNGRLIQFNSSLSYVYSQAYAGTFPLFDHVAIIQRHSLLGVGSAVSALSSLLDQVEVGLFLLPFEEIASSPYTSSYIRNKDFFACFQETYFHEPGRWQSDTTRQSVIRSSDPTKNNVSIPNDYFIRLAFFSGRLGFREYDLSATAAIQVLVESNSLQWNIINYTHEIIHNHVRIILNQLLVPPTSMRSDNYETLLAGHLTKLAAVFSAIKNTTLPENISYQDYFTLVLIKFCINFNYYGSLSHQSNQKLLGDLRADSTKKIKYNLPTPEELCYLIKLLYKDISEIFVHVLDFSYIYARDADTYLQSIWASWSTVISVSIDLKQYVLRTLIVVALKETGTIDNRYERSKLAFIRLLEKIAPQNGNSYLFTKIKEMLGDGADADLKDRFSNCIIVADIAYNFFVGELETFFDNEDQNRLGKTPDEEGKILVYGIDRNSFSGAAIKSKVRFLLGQLIREIADSTSSYEDPEKERVSTWLLLSLSSYS